METGIHDRGAWARFWANMGGVELDVAPLIFDPSKTSAPDVSTHRRWFGEWYGRDVDVQHAFHLLATDTPASLPVSHISFFARDGAALLLDADSTVASQGGVRIALSVVHVLARGGAAGTSRLFVITRSAQVARPAAAAGADRAGAAHAGAWGFGRSVRVEHPRLQLFSHDAGDTTAARCAIEPQQELETAWLDGNGHVQRLRRHLAVGTDRHAPLGGLWLITGGLGGLGLRGAALLSSCGAQLVLSSKSGRVTREGQGLSEALQALPLCAQPTVATCDSSDCNEQVSTHLQPNPVLPRLQRML